MEALDDEREGHVREQVDIEEGFDETVIDCVSIVSV
jgi:hypothetical protein